MLKLQTLGFLSLRDGEGNEASAVLSQPKRLALLVYLSLARPRGPHRRDTLLSLFWPERPDTRGRNALSQSLSFLRQNLPEPMISTGGGEAVGLEPGTLSSDVEAFENAIAAKRWRDALDLYRGDFLRGFHIGGAWGFEDWVETERERLREMAAGAAWSLAQEQVTRGALVEAERTAQKALALVWSDETPLRRFIEALAKAGDGAAALNLYEKFCCRLREELELEPSPVTASVAEAIRNGEIGASPPVDPSPGVSSPEDPSSITGLPDEPSTSTGPEGGLPAVAASESGIAAPESDLEVPKSGVATPKPWAAAPKPAPKRRFPIVVLVGASILATALVTYAFMRNGDTPVPDPHLVVVPPFENRTGDPEFDVYADMTAEWVAEALQQVERVLLVPLGDTRQIVAGLAEAGSTDVLRGVGERTGAGWLVSGALAPAGDSIEFRVEIIDVARWAREQPVAAAGPKADPREAIGELARRVSGALAFQFNPMMGDIEQGGQLLPNPPRIETFREHRLGYEAYDREDWEASFRHHLAAYALDTTLVRAAVAAAYMTTDHAVKDSLARFASQRRHMLSLRGKSDLDILLPLVDHDLQGLLGAMRGGAAMNRTGFSTVTHAWAAIVVNRPGEAVEALSHYDPYLEWRIGEAHAYWDYLTMALHMRQDYERELAEARAGRVMYPTRSDLMAAEVRSLAALGRVGEVMELVREAPALPQSPAFVMLAAGEELRAHGFPQASIEVFEMAFEELRAWQAG